LTTFIIVVILTCECLGSNNNSSTKQRLQNEKFNVTSQRRQRNFNLSKESTPHKRFDLRGNNTRKHLELSNNASEDDVRKALEEMKDDQGNLY